MSYFVVVTFDLKSADSSDYEAAKKALARIGLYPELIGSNKRPSNLPMNTFAGEFEGGSTSKVRDDLSDEVKTAFERLGLSSSIFVSVAQGWAWGRRST